VKEHSTLAHRKTECSVLSWSRCSVHHTHFSRMSCSGRSSLRTLCSRSAM
jgi:hypothetical protein